jgi:uncharacterized protein (DUF983 family)
MKGSKIYSIFRGKCPVCQETDAFLYKNLYNLKKFDKMPETCSNCGHKYEKEQGFWIGAMYVSYALTVAFSVATFVSIYLLFPNTGAWSYILAIIVVVVGLAPITFRLSRLIWMNMFTTYDKSKSIKSV